MKKFLLILACLFSSLSSHAADLPPFETPVRLGLVGLGNHMTEKLIPSLDLDKFTLVSGCRRNLSELKKQKEKYGFSTITADYNDIFSHNEIDAIIVSGAPELHTEVVKAALEHGVHVFVEKPVSLALNDVQVLAQLAAQKNNIISAVGFNLSYIPSIALLKQKLSENELNNLAIKCTLGSPLNQTESLAQTFENAFYFAFIHPLSFMIDLMGTPQDIKVEYKKESHPQGFSLDVLATYEKGQKARIYFANCCVLGGFNFHIAYDDKHGSHIIDTTKKNSLSFNEKQLSYQNELNAFYHSIKSGQPHRNNLQRNLEIHDVLEQIKTKVSEQISFS